MFKLNIKDMRIKLGMTQKELATELGVSQSLISKLEKEGFERELSPSLELLESIAKTLRCCPMTLIQIRCEYCSIGIKEQDKHECATNTKCILQKRLDSWQKN